MLDNLKKTTENIIIAAVRCLLGGIKKYPRQQSAKYNKKQYVAPLSYNVVALKKECETEHYIKKGISFLHPLQESFRLYNTLYVTHKRMLLLQMLICYFI